MAQGRILSPTSPMHSNDMFIQNPGKMVPGKTFPARPFPTVWCVWDRRVSVEHLLSVESSAAIIDKKFKKC